MFILTGLVPEQNMAQVFDTSDKTNETICFSVLVQQIRAGRIKVKGLNTRGKGLYLQPYNIYVDNEESQAQMAKFYQKIGYTA
jgi:hypothetical protein